MISFIVRMRFLSEDHHEITDVLEKLTAASRLEPGCVTYVPHWCEDSPDTVLIYEQYKDSAAAEAHRHTPHFQEYAVAGLYQRMRERQVESLHAIA
jgi:quinol monooxygenase YgiN